MAPSTLAGDSSNDQCSSAVYNPVFTQTLPVTRVAVDAITLVINECVSITSAMRKMTRWSQSGVAAILSGGGDIFGDEESIASKFGLQKNNNLNNFENHLLSPFVQLRIMLLEANTLSEIDGLTLLQPFLLVIKSSSTTGHITSLALDSLTKFLSYGIISHDSKNINTALIQIITSLTHCRFEAAEQTSDDAVLLKVLRLLENILQSPISNLLPNESISEVIQTCLSLACNKKRSEVLRRAAEMAMMSITIRVFNSLKDMKSESHAQYSTNYSNTQLPEDIIGGTNSNDSKISFEKQSTNDQESTASPIVDVTEDINELQIDKEDSKEGTEGVGDAENGNADQEPVLLQTTHTYKDEESKVVEPFDISCINEFLGILISMISPANQFQHMESTRVFALSLINTAVEVSGDYLPQHSSLMTLVLDPICKHVLQIIQHADSPALLQGTLQLFTTLAIVLGPYLKCQIELTLSMIFKSTIPENKKTDNGKLKDNSNTRSPTAKEMLIESISLLWTRTPIFFTKIFIDYDCDFERSDLCTDSLNNLCDLAIPQNSMTITDNVPPICLDGILSFIDGINDRIKVVVSQGKEVNSLPDNELIMRKEKKKEFIRCSKVLNEKPKEGIKLLAAKGFIKSDDFDELATFFFNKSGRLNKKMLGEFLAKPSNTELLKKFMSLFEFKDLRVDEALRMLLKSFRLPGESQQIERIVELFADRYVSCQGEEEEVNSCEDEVVRPDRDAVFVLSYSVIMLNTDLHNPQVKKQMELSQYQRNLRGIYNGKDFPSWYLEKIYFSIRDKEIIMPEEHHGTGKGFDDIWNNLVTSQANNIVSHDIEDPVVLCQFDKVIFQSIIDKVLKTLIKVFNEATDDHIVTRLMSSIDKCANISMYFQLDPILDQIVSSLADLTTLINKKFISTTEDGLRDEIPITQIKIEEKDQIITVSELAVWFGKNFKAQLSTVVLFRIIKKTDYKVTQSWEKVMKIVLTLFENCLFDPNIFPEFQKNLKLSHLPKAKPQYSINRSKPLRESGLLQTFSSFLKGYSDEPPEPTDQEVEATLSTIDCVKSTDIRNIFLETIKLPVDQIDKFSKIIMNFLPQHTKETDRIFESETLFLIEIVVCFSLISNSDNIIENLINKIHDLSTDTKLASKSQIRLITYKLLLLRISSKSNPELLNSTMVQLNTFDKETINKNGKQLSQPLKSLADVNAWSCQILLSDNEYWKILRTMASLPSFTGEIFEFIEGIVKSTPDEINHSNYMSLLGLLDEISSVGAIGAQWEQEYDQLVLTGHRISKDDFTFKEIVEISKNSINLTSRLTTILKNDKFSNDNSYSLIQALAHQCFNPCREIRSHAVNSLRLTILSLKLDGPVTPYGIFESGLFPLLSEILKPEVLQTDHFGFIKTQEDLLSLIKTIFLQNVTKIDKEKIQETWLKIVDFFKKFIDYEASLSRPNKSLEEIAIESIKNMVLVLQDSGLLVETNKEFWDSTWLKIDEFFPGLKSELVV